MILNEGEIALNFYDSSYLEMAGIKPLRFGKDEQYRKRWVFEDTDELRNELLEKSRDEWLNAYISAMAHLNYKSARDHNPKYWPSYNETNTQ